jgi:transcriptional regulator with XRE-family HTH domain
MDSSSHPRGGRHERRYRTPKPFRSGDGDGPRASARTQAIAFPVCPPIAETDHAAERPSRTWYAQDDLGHSIGLGCLILTLRELKGLSQAKLAARVGSTQPAIARLESGRQVPSVNTLLRIARACGMPLAVGSPTHGSTRPTSASTTSRCSACCGRTPATTCRTSSSFESRLRGPASDRPSSGTFHRSP